MCKSGQVVRCVIFTRLIEHPLIILEGTKNQ